MLSFNPFLHSIFFLLLLMPTFTKGQVQAKADRPNIIFILTDDQSYGMMGCDGETLTQPPIFDQLAE